jgi:hypothetical protein
VQAAKSAREDTPPRELTAQERAELEAFGQAE